MCLGHDTNLPCSATATATTAAAAAARWGATASGEVKRERSEWKKEVIRVAVIETASNVLRSFTCVCRWIPLCSSPLAYVVILAGPSPSRRRRPRLADDARERGPDGSGRFAFSYWRFAVLECCIDANGRRPVAVRALSRLLSVVEDEGDERICR